MIDKLYAVCRIYHNEQYGEVHTIDSCYYTKEEAEEFLTEYYPEYTDFYIDEVTDEESVKSLHEGYFSEGIEK